MNNRFLITLCCVLFLSDGLLAEEENEIKRGNYPYMAFIYYPDETVVDATGSRYLRGAVLVKPDWLVSSTVEPTMSNDVHQGFPLKTLMARLGATNIDANFTLNEDEDEQEREVIQIVRPYNHSTTQWWLDDISLLKTLLPFNQTSAVAVATIRWKPNISGNCYILVFTTRVGNVSDDRVLTQLLVELQPPSMGYCGPHFKEETMLCASDSDETKNAVDDDFCLGNSGGPLVCENEVAGIQTYVENNCKPPHLYQHLSAWENFITCGTEDKCHDDSCANTCLLIHKDQTKDVTPAKTIETVSSASTTVTEEITIPIRYSTTTTETMLEEDELTTQSPTLTTTTEKLPTTEKTTISETAATTTMTTKSTTTDASASEKKDDSSWPKMKQHPVKTLEADENKIERKISVEAQKQDVKIKKIKRARGAAERNMCVFESLFILCVLVSLM